MDLVVLVMVHSSYSFEWSDLNVDFRKTALLVCKKNESRATLSQISHPLDRLFHTRTNRGSAISAHSGAARDWIPPVEKTHNTHTAHIRRVSNNRIG